MDGSPRVLFRLRVTGIFDRAQGHRSRCAIPPGWSLYQYIYASYSRSLFSIIPTFFFRPLNTMSKFLNLLSAFVLISPVLSMAQEAGAAPAGFGMYASSNVAVYLSTDHESVSFTSHSTNISSTGSGCPAGSTVTVVNGRC